MMCYIVLLLLLVYMDVRVRLEWMSAMICAVVLLSPLVLMDVRVRLEWMFAIMCCRFAVTFGAHGCTWCREPVFEQAVSAMLYFCISLLCAMYMVSRARL